MEEFDVVIVGAGMAGASLAWALAPKRRVLLLEQETQPGYHSTGRSAATLHSSYGNATVRALTAASAPFYRAPPPGFAADRPRPPAGRPDGRRRGPARPAGGGGRVCACVRSPAGAVETRRSASLGCRPCGRSGSPAPCTIPPCSTSMSPRSMPASCVVRVPPGPRCAPMRPMRAAERSAGGWRRAAARRRDRLCRPGGRRRSLGRPGRRGRWHRALGHRAQAAHGDHRPDAARQRSRELAHDRRHGRGMVRQAGCRPAPVLAGRRDAVRTRRRAARRDRRRHLRRPHRDRVRPHHPADREPLGRPALLRPRQDAGGRLRPARAGLLLARRPGRLRHPDRPGDGRAGRRPDLRRRAAAQLGCHRRWRCWDPADCSPTSPIWRRER